MTTDKPRWGGVLSRVQLPAFLEKDSSLSRRLALLWFGVGTSVGIGLLVVGMGLVALGVTIVLNGFGLVTINLPTELGASLASGLVIGVFGALALGLGVESQAGHGYVRWSAEPWEIAVAHLPGLVIFAWLMSVAGSLLERVIVDAPAAFGLITRYMSAVGSAAFVAGIVGVPALWAIHQFVVPREPRFADLAPAAVFVAWALASLNSF